MQKQLFHSSPQRKCLLLGGKGEEGSGVQMLAGLHTCKPCAVKGFPLHTPTRAFCVSYWLRKNIWLDLKPYTKQNNDFSAEGTSIFALQLLFSCAVRKSSDNSVDHAASLEQDHISDLHW